jgi:hypothetical protein
MHAEMEHVPTWNFIPKSVTLGNDQWECMAEWETNTLLVLCQGNNVEFNAASFKKTRAESAKAVAMRQQKAFLVNAQDENPQVAKQWMDRATDCAKTIKESDEMIAKCENVTETLSTWRFPLSEIQ